MLNAWMMRADTLALMERDALAAIARWEETVSNKPECVVSKGMLDEARSDIKTIELLKETARP